MPSFFHVMTSICEIIFRLLNSVVIVKQMASDLLEDLQELRKLLELAKRPHVQALLSNEISNLEKVTSSTSAQSNVSEHLSVTRICPYSFVNAPCTSCISISDDYKFFSSTIP